MAYNLLFFMAQELRMIFAFPKGCEEKGMCTSSKGGPQNLGCFLFDPLQKKSAELGTKVTLLSLSELYGKNRHFFSLFLIFLIGV